MHIEIQTTYNSDGKVAFSMLVCPKCKHTLSTYKWMERHIDGPLCKSRLFRAKIEDMGWVIIHNKYIRAITMSGIECLIETVGRGNSKRQGDRILAVPSHTKDMIDLYEKGNHGWAGLNLKTWLEKSCQT